MRLVCSLLSHNRYHSAYLTRASFILVFCCSILPHSCPQPPMGGKRMKIERRGKDEDRNERQRRMVITVGI